MTSSSEQTTALIARLRAESKATGETDGNSLLRDAAAALEAATKDAQVVESYGIDYGDEIEEGYKSVAHAEESLARTRRQSATEDLYLYEPGTIMMRTVTTVSSPWEPVGGTE